MALFSCPILALSTEPLRLLFPQSLDWRIGPTQFRENLQCYGDGCVPGVEGLIVTFVLTGYAEVLVLTPTVRRDQVDAVPPIRGPCQLMTVHIVKFDRDGKIR